MELIRLILKTVSFVFLLFNYAFADEFKLEETKLSKGISIIYEELLKKPYMVDPKILEMNERITFYLSDDVPDKYGFFVRYFDNMNIKVFSKNGTDYLKYVEPVKPTPKPKKNVGVSYVYKPKYRGVEYLSENLMSFIDSSLNVNKEDSFSGSINTKGDVLLIHADKNTISKIRTILPELDTKPKQVIVTARLLEVKKNENHQSALNILANVLQNRLNINFSLGTMSDSIVSLKTSNVNGVFSIFDNESSFNTISSPILRVMDGESGNFTVGSDVPTLGGENVNRDGSITRQINYRSSGVIFDLKPVISDSGIKLKIRSELSGFTNTENGVNNTPTLLKRLVDSTVYLRSGDLIVLGGLSEEKNTKVEDSFFFLPSWVFGKSKKFEKSDILLMLHVRLVDDFYNAIDLDKSPFRP